MKGLILPAGLALGLCFIHAVNGAAAEPPPSLDPLQGKWTVAKTNQDGQPYSQAIEIRKDRLSFELRDAANEVRFAGKATIKAEKSGAFLAFVLSNIEAGRSTEDLRPVEESRAFLYRLQEDRLFVASNFDRERENERPQVDAYTRLENRAQPATGAAEGETKVLGLWKLEVTLGDSSRDYELRLSKAEGRLGAVLISPRSGERRCKSAEFKDGQLVVKVEREINGNAATIVYKARLDGDTLKGTVAVEGAEDQYSGQVKGTR